MPLTFAIRCDCGLAKTHRRNGLLICDHCDTGGCDGKCARCTAYTAGFVRRVILRTYGR